MNGNKKQRGMVHEELVVRSDRHRIKIFACYIKANGLGKGYWVVTSTVYTTVLWK